MSGRFIFLMERPPADLGPLFFSVLPRELREKVTENLKQAEGLGLNDVTNEYATLGGEAERRHIDLFYRPTPFVPVPPHNHNDWQWSRQLGEETAKKNLKILEVDGAAKSVEHAMIDYEAHEKRRQMGDKARRVTAVKKHIMKLRRKK